MIWHWPQYTYVAMFTLSQIIAVAKYARGGDAAGVFGALVAAAMTWVLLYYGGFFAGAAP